MVIEDYGIIISIKVFQENSLIIKCLLKDHGLISGIMKVRGKYKTKPSPGEIIQIRWQARLEEHLGFITIEHINFSLHEIIANKCKIYALNSILTLLSYILNEKERNIALYNNLEGFIRKISRLQFDIEVLKEYVIFEVFNVLNFSGFGIDLNKCVVTGAVEGLAYISPKSASAVSKKVGQPYHDKLFQLPQFLIDPNMEANSTEILKAFDISEYFLNKNVLSNIGRKMPKSRLMLQDILGTVNNA